MTWKRRRRWLIPVAVLACLGFLAKSLHWASEGCPMGFSMGSCASNITGGRSIVASSDHLLDEVTLAANALSAVIKLGKTRVVILGDVATIDRSTEFSLPAACKKVEFSVRGKAIQVLADGRDLAPSGRPVQVDRTDRPR